MVNTRDRLSALYTEDFVAWVEETTRLMKAGSIDSLDWPHLIEEIEGLGSEQKHKVDSYLLQLLIHLLLYRYWNSEREWSGRGWSIEIANFRTQLEILFRSRTLYNYFQEEIEVIYPKAVKLAAKKSDLPKSLFPETCPFSADEIMNEDFLPSIA
ncbi:DUF29 domain-containing protein [Pannus brasiliensis CCIBt3594]|uniref:DUF29 domain-containing protein n=1 Tax=Pannus brasiliensis CCIBt3594 TaxID=1427578 RepID=A0AAW9R0B8_9CHRO